MPKTRTESQSCIWNMRRRLSDKANGSKLESTIIGRPITFWKHLVYLFDSSYFYPYLPSCLEISFQKPGNNLVDVTFSKTL